MKILFEIKQRLVYNIVAGINLLSEDFRLKHYIENFEQYSIKNNTFNKIYNDLQKLYDENIDNKEFLIIDLLGLIDAILCTIAVSKIDGEINEFNNFDEDIFVEQVSYSTLFPFINSILTSGSGRFEIIFHMVKESPNFLKDYRTLNLLISSFNDKYDYIYKLCYKVLGVLATRDERDFKMDYPVVKEEYLKDIYVDKNKIINLLKKDFYNTTKKEMELRFKLISEISKENENDFYIEVLNSDIKNNNLKLLVIKALSYDIKNLDLILELFKKGKENVKKLIMIESMKWNISIPEINIFCEKYFEKNPKEISILIDFSNNYLSDLIADKLMYFIDNFDKNKFDLINIIHEYILASSNKTSDKMLNFWRYYIENYQNISQKLGKKNIDYINMVVIEVLEKFILTFNDNNNKIVNLLYSLKEVLPKPIEYVLFLSDILTKPSDILYDYWHTEKQIERDIFKRYYSIIHNNRYNNFIYISTNLRKFDGDSLFFEKFYYETNNKLDLRWLEDFRKFNLDYLLFEFLPNNDYKLLNTYGKYFYERAFVFFKDTFVSYSLDINFYLTALSYCNYNKYDGILSNYFINNYNNFLQSQSKLIELFVLFRGFNEHTFNTLKTEYEKIVNFCENENLYKRNKNLIHTLNYIKNYIESENNK